jgi:hypothetical protein
MKSAIALMKSDEDKKSKEQGIDRSIIDDRMSL